MQKKKQLVSGIKVEQTRRIANVCIQVERETFARNIESSAIQLIFFVTARNGDATTLDKIVTICCAPDNMHESELPFD